MTTQTRGTEEQVHLKNKYLANCDNEANRAGVKASLVAAAGCLGADYLFTKNCQTNKEGACESMWVCV